jgi:HAE1 family hydrophobic/amphiphilic exporter-1
LQAFFAVSHHHRLAAVRNFRPGICQEFREGGLPLEEALVRAGRVRVRPILMTTLATLFGLLPLALGLGSGAELQKPLALAVIGGLVLSTLITLLVMPVLYSLMARQREATPS